MQLKRENKQKFVERQRLLTNDHAIAKVSPSELRANFPQKQGQKLLFATGLVAIAGFLVVGTPNAIAEALTRGPLITCGGDEISEAEQNVGAINSAQETHLSEKNVFANDLKKLGFGSENQTEEYQYSTRATPSGAFNYGIARKNELKGYVGAVFLVPVGGGNPAPTNVTPKGAKQEMTTLTIMCVANSPGTNKPAEPTYQNGSVACGANTTEAYRYSP